MDFNYARSCCITVRDFSLRDIIPAAIQHHTSKNGRKINSNDLKYILINHIRHNLTNYDRLLKVRLFKTDGSESDEGYKIIKSRVNATIKRIITPQLSSIAKRGLLSAYGVV